VATRYVSFYVDPPIKGTHAMDSRPNGFFWKGCTLCWVQTMQNISAQIWIYKRKQSCASLVTTAWCVLRLRMEGRPPAMECSTMKNQLRVADNVWSSSLEVWHGANDTSRQKNKPVTKHLHKTLTLTNSLDKRSKRQYGREIRGIEYTELV
jgi:hypothetical protein